MTDESAGTNQRGGQRRPYMKPFVKNLDIVETEGGKELYVIETAGHGVSLGSPS